MIELITLPLIFERNEIKLSINPVVIKENDDLTLIDTGYPMFSSVIEKAFEENGLNIKNLKQIILTHHDHDHMGAAKEIVKKYPSVNVKCSKEQLPYVLGKKKSLRLEQAEIAGADSEFMKVLKSVEYLDSALVVEDNEIICSGVKVVKTPGHMPGHISIYVEPMKTLISGDFLVCKDGVLGIADEKFVLDKEEEINSLKKIINLDIERIICFHGGEYKSNNLREDLKNIILNGYEKNRK